VSFVYEYTLCLLVIISITRELMGPPARLSWVIENQEQIRRGHRAWLEHIQTARSEGVLGPLRLEYRPDGLCVVGLGQCRHVHTIEEGVQQISMLQAHIVDIVEAGRPTTLPPASGDPVPHLPW
jgi:hypothetical protein